MREIIQIDIEFFIKKWYNINMIDTAVLGGAFDPVHIEHYNIALAAVKELDVKRLVLVPTNCPPHKKTSEASFSHRVKMLKIAFKDFPIKTEISDVENTTKEVHYAAEIIPKLKQKYGDFYYILGGDSLLKLDTWYKPEEVVKQANIVAFNREGYPDITDKIDELNTRWNCNIKKLNYVGGDSSSYELRARLNLCMPTEELHMGVYDYIANFDLYNTYRSIMYKLPSFLSKERLIHSKNVTLMALKLNYRCGLGLPYEDVFTAAILHDIGKKFDCDDYAFQKYTIPLDSISTPVQHQFIGAELAEREFGITNQTIINAIKYHTTGRADMTTLEKLVYSADMVSTERCYVAAEELREALFENFEQGVKMCVEYSYSYLKQLKRNIYPLTIEAADFYKEIL